MKKKLSLFLPLFIFIIATIQYSNSINFDYAWDDKLVITGNEYTTKGIDGLGDIFTKAVSVPYKNVYRPIPQAMFAIEYDLFNQSPKAGHFFNMVWYAFACVVVYFFIGFVFPRYHVAFSFLVALLFVVHPLHVEVVANIKSRDEILTLLFGLLFIMLTVKAIENRRWVFFIPALVCFAMAFLSKGNAITLMPIAVLALWYRSKQILLTRSTIIFSAGIVISSILLVAIFRFIESPYSAGGSEMHLDPTVLNNIFLWTTHPEMIIPTSLVIIGRYLILFIYPHTLIHLYGYDQISMSSWYSPETWVMVIIALFVVFYVFKMWKKKGPFVFGIIFFICTYSVYSNLVILAPDTMADRYMFLPSIGLCIIAVEGVFRMASLSFTAPSIKTLRQKLILTLFLSAICFYAIKTWHVSKDWENDFTLVFNRIKKMSNNAAAQATYGFMLHKASNEATSNEEMSQKRIAAMKAYTKAIEIYPDFYWAWISIGKLFAEQEIYDKSELVFLKAHQLQPQSADGYFCLGSLYYTLGDGKLAIAYLENAIMIEPGEQQSYVMLGRAYLLVGNIDNLMALSQAAMKWFPKNPEFDVMTATYFFQMGKYQQAKQLVQRALQKNPKHISALALMSSPLMQ